VRTFEYARPESLESLLALLHDRPHTDTDTPARGERLRRIRADLVVQEGERHLAVDNFVQSIANEAKSRVSKSSI